MNIVVNNDESEVVGERILHGGIRKLNISKLKGNESQKKRKLLRDMFDVPENKTMHKNFHKQILKQPLNSSSKLH